MAIRKWELDPDTWEVPTIQGFENDWFYIPDRKMRKVLAVQHQYLILHLQLLDSLRSKELRPPRPPSVRLGLSARAGGIHAGILICGSIAEGALYAHAKKRGYPLGDKPTFGELIGSFRKGKAMDMKPLLKDLNVLNEWRNDTHLYRLAERDQGWKHWVREEQKIWDKAVGLLMQLQDIKST